MSKKKLNTEYSTEEIKSQVISHMKNMIRYWDNQNISSKEKLEGFGFSVLNMLDGGAADLPKFIVAPDPHPSDKKYLHSLGEKNYPENIDSNVKGNISGGLHYLLHK